MKTSINVIPNVSIPRKRNIFPEGETFTIDNKNEILQFDINSIDYNEKDEEICYIDVDIDDGCLLLDVKLNDLEYFAKSILLIIEAHRQKNGA